MQSWQALGIVLCAAGCADVWGLQTLEVGDDGSPGDAKAPSADARIDRMGDRAAMEEAPDVGGGSCVVDVTVACADPAQVGFTCTGSAAPSDSYPALSCSPGPSTASLCCSGNWCGGTTDTDPCNQCTLQSCASPLCACGTDCSSYYTCVDTCFDTLKNCESGCAPGYATTDVTAGTGIFTCQIQYCNAECQIL
jgi:hypothetical protein